MVALGLGRNQWDAPPIPSEHGRAKVKKYGLNQLGEVVEFTQEESIKASYSRIKMVSSASTWS